MKMLQSNVTQYASKNGVQFRDCMKSTGVGSGLKWGAYISLFLSVRPSSAGFLWTLTYLTPIWLQLTANVTIDPSVILFS